MHIKLNFFLYSIIIASGLTHNYSYTSIEAAALAGSGAVEAGTIGLGVAKVVAVVKAGAVAIAAAPATPYIVAGAVLYGGYNMCQSSGPDQKEIAQAEKRNAEIAQYQAQAEYYKAQGEQYKAVTLQAQKQQQILQAEDEFKRCVFNNMRTTELPSPCKKLASAFAVVAGSEAVDKVVDSFNRYPNS
jgi:hypothetical protein